MSDLILMSGEYDVILVSTTDGQVRFPKLKLDFWVRIFWCNFLLADFYHRMCCRNLKTSLWQISSALVKDYFS